MFLGCERVSLPDGRGAVELNRRGGEGEGDGRVAVRLVRPVGRAEGSTGRMDCRHGRRLGVLRAYGVRIAPCLRGSKPAGQRVWAS